jgi:methylated-DNA-[protein]-cysteine S-methyltransferase
MRESLHATTRERLGSMSAAAETTRALYTIVATPVGELLVCGDHDAVAGIHFVTSPYAPTPRPGWLRAPDAFLATQQQLDEYFAGHRTVFDLPLRANRGSGFFRAVWGALQRVPFGCTTTYSAIARELGAPGAARAVGLANARNPFSIVVPCHRVLGTDHALRGYAGGIEAKRALLDHEARVAASVPMPAVRRPGLMSAPAPAPCPWPAAACAG